MLRVTELEKRFSPRKSDIVRALDGVSFTVTEGKLFTLLGASGSGKTTTLRSIAGLERPDAGRIEIDDIAVFDSSASLFVRPNKRNLGMVFQSYAIWPHMTVFDNVAFPLRVKRRGRAEIREEVGRTLALMNMEHLSRRSRFRTRSHSCTTAGSCSKDRRLRSTTRRSRSTWPTSSARRTSCPACCAKRRQSVRPVS